MSKMKDKIVGYLNLNTSSDNVFVDINDVANAIFDEVNEDTISDFNLALIALTEEKLVRVHQKEDRVCLGLEENIKVVLDDIKAPAIKEMEDEMNECVKAEDYEGAAEWKKLIDESL